MCLNYRIKLIISIIQGKITNNPPGSGINIDELKERKAALACFPIHDYEDLRVLQSKLLNILGSPKNMPIGNYFTRYDININQLIVNEFIFVFR